MFYQIKVISPKWRCQLSFSTISSSLAFSLFSSSISVSAEPSRPHGGHDGHREESEPSDDEMLSLSHQRANAGTAPPKPDPPSVKPAAKEPPEEVDLLGLDGGGISCPCPSTQPPSAATTTDLLGDLFGGPPQPSSGASSAQSTPHKVAPNTASPCPSPAPAGETHYKHKHYFNNICIIMATTTIKCLLASAFDPFGAGPMPKPQDVMGSFLGPGNVGQTDPFLHVARSPSPTLQPASFGKMCPSGSASHLHILDAVGAASG